RGIKEKFIVALQGKGYDLTKFYELFCSSLLLLDTKHSHLQQKSIPKEAKSNPVKEKEDFFKIKLTEFMLEVLPPGTSADAYLKSKDHSDIILFNKSKLTEYT